MDIDLAGLEHAALNRTADRWPRLLAGLRGLVNRAAVQQTEDPAFAARFAAAAASIIADPVLEPTPDQIMEALVYRQELETLVRTSPIGSFDHVLRAMGFSPRGGTPAVQAVEPGKLARATVLLSLDSDVEFGPSDILALRSDLAQVAYIALLATKPVVSPLGAARREAFAARAGELRPAPLPATLNHLTLTSVAWMLCSYASHPAKHRIKPVLNRSLVELAGRIGISAPPLPERRPIRERPRMVVAAEIMHSNHVQFRYFGQYLRQLRQKFELVLLTEESEVDDAVQALYDEVHTFARGSRGEHLMQAARVLTETRPDIVFWPSVGMRHWGPLLANLRFAPIQMTALGHSASTFCEAIDYYLTEEGYVSDPALFGERLLLLPDEALVFERPPSYAPTPAEVRAAPRPLRIALPSNLLKLNPHFLRVLRKIRNQAGRDLEFHVFPNAGGTEHLAIRRVIQAVLPGAHIHGRLTYGEYLQRLSACDLNLSPFPFGGLHSVVDSLRQGLPVVALECPEPHGRTDAMLLRRLGMPHWLVAATEDDYVTAALRVIGDDALRVELSHRALALDLDRLLFGDAQTPLRSEVVDAVWWAYLNHDEVVARGQRVVRPADWAVG
jgi:Predicted O-linked N-acetylglucosamine transferase, SPINDLY family